MYTNDRVETGGFIYGTREALHEKSRIHDLYRTGFVALVLILLLTMLLPSLKNATNSTKHITCMTNMRQLSMAWIGYANDHHSKLVNGEVDAVVVGAVYLS